MKTLKSIGSIFTALLIAVGAINYINANEQSIDVAHTEDLHWFNVEGAIIKEYIPAPTTPCLEPAGTVLCAVGLTDAQIIGEDDDGNPIPAPTVDPTDPNQVEQRFEEDQ